MPPFGSELERVGTVLMPPVRAMNLQVFSQIRFFALSCGSARVDRPGFQAWEPRGGEVRVTRFPPILLNLVAPPRD